MTQAAVRDVKMVRELYDNLVARYRSLSLSRTDDVFEFLYIEERTWLPKFFYGQEMSFYNCPDMLMDVAVDKLCEMENDLTVLTRTGSCY